MRNVICNNINKNASKKIILNKLQNTRDLGGIHTKYGSIPEKRLIRSGHLFVADEHDIQLLSELSLRKIFDFRSTIEMNEKPDPVVPGAEFIHLPIVEDMTGGLSRDEESDKSAIEMVMTKFANDPQAAILYMIDTYKRLVTDPFSISQYAKFLSEVYMVPDGAVLWHCTAGKDRAGFATVLILEILGTHRDDIMEDYLSTAVHLEPEIVQLIKMITSLPGMQDAEEAVRELFGVREEYLLTNYKILDENYGGMENYLQNVLHVDINAWRKKYYL